MLVKQSSKSSHFQRKRNGKYNEPVPIRNLILWTYMYIRQYAHSFLRSTSFGLNSIFYLINVADDSTELDCKSNHFSLIWTANI